MIEGTFLILYLVLTLRIYKIFPIFAIIKRKNALWCNRFRINNQELINKFNTEIEQITNRQTTMGIEEFVLNRERRVGKKEGKQEGVEETTYEKDVAFVKSLLTQTDFSEEKIVVLVGVDIEFVQKVKTSLK